MQHKKSSEIIRENLTYMLNQEGTPSMRNLSTSIGTSDSYIQKILNQERPPSLDKIDSISEFFDVESWEMFYNFRKDRPEMLTIMQQLNKLSPTLLPSVKAYLDFLLAQQDELLLSTKKISSCQGISYNFQTSACIFCRTSRLRFHNCLWYIIECLLDQLIQTSSHLCVLLYTLGHLFWYFLIFFIRNTIVHFCPCIHNQCSKL